MNYYSLTNNKTRIQIILILFLAVSLLFKKETADTLIIAPTYTVNPNQPWAEAVAIKDNTIIFVGDKETAENYLSNSTKVIESSNGMVLPGFIDTHVHLLWGGVEMNDCKLYNLKTQEQIFAAIMEFNNNNPDVDWIRGGGWEPPIFPNGNPRKEWLDEIITDKPVYLSSADGHSAWVNSKALDIAKINSETIDPVNGRIERDPKTGDPSGVLREDAMTLVDKLLPPYSIEQIENGLIFSVKEAHKFGITSILDAGTGSIATHDGYDGLDAYRDATAQKQIALRLATTQYANARSWRTDLKVMKKRRFNNELGKMNTVKIFADGVIEGGTAALLEPYVGTEDRGILNWHPDTLKTVIAAFDKEGFQIHVHAIGDWAIRSTLDAFEYARNQNGDADKRHMMSHVQLIHPEDVHRFKELNIIASFQPLWAYPDKYITELTLPVLGPDRSPWNYPIQSVVSAGGRVAGGSDWTVSSLNPLDAIEVAVTRREPGKKDGDALYPEEAVSLETILRAYTMEGAYSLFKEDEIGSIEKGKQADIIILDQNLFEIPVHEIHNTKVTHTLFSGKVVYKKE